MYQYLFSLLVSVSLATPAFAKQEPNFRTSQDPISASERQDNSDPESTQPELLKTKGSGGGGGHSSGGGGGSYHASPSQKSNYSHEERRSEAPRVRETPRSTERTSAPSRPAKNEQYPESQKTRNAPVPISSERGGVGVSGKPAQAHRQVAPAALNRSNKSGVNSQRPMQGDKPIPVGHGAMKVNERTADGRATGRSAIYRKDGSISSMTKKDGTHVTYGKDGKATAIRSKDGTEVHINKDNSRSVVRQDAKGNTLTTRLDKNGNVLSHESTRNVGGQTIRSRTTIVNNRTVVRNYNSYSYRGSSFYGYHPYYGYSSGFYSGFLFASVLWGSPFSYYNGWAPFYGYGWYSPYSYFFSPWRSYGYGNYIGVHYFLTDLLIFDLIESYHERKQAELAQDQARAQQAQQPVNYVETDHPTMSEEVKQQIASQVKEQLDAAKEGQSASIEKSLANPNYHYIVGGDEDIDAMDQNDDTCELSKGDIVKLAEAFDPNAKDVSDVKMRVVTSKRSSCKAGAVVSISLEQMQEMQNSLAEGVEKAQQKLTGEAGRNGLPAAPAGVSLEATPTIPDDQAAAELAQAQKEAAALKAKTAEIEASAAADDAPPIENEPVDTTNLDQKTGSSSKTW